MIQRRSQLLVQRFLLTKYISIHQFLTPQIKKWVFKSTSSNLSSNCIQIDVAYLFYISVENREKQTIILRMFSITGGGGGGEGRRNNVKDPIFGDIGSK